MSSNADAGKESIEMDQLSQTVNQHLAAEIMENQARRKQEEQLHKSSLPIPINVGNVKPRKKPTLGQDEKVWTKDFYETTHLHGFSFIQQSRSWWEGILWYLLIAVFLAIMIKDILALVNQYTSQPTATQVTLQFNKSLHPPITTICLPVRVNDWLKINETTQEPWPNETEIGDLLAAYKSKEHFLSSYFTNRKLFLIIHHLLGFSLTLMETAEGNSRVLVEKEDLSAQSLETNTTDLLESFMERLGISHLELGKKFGEIMANFFGIEMTFRKKSWDFNPATYSLTQFSWIGYSKICFMFNLTSGGIKIDDIEDYMTMGANFYKLGTLPKGVEVDFRGHPKISTTDRSTRVAGTFGHTEQVSLEIRGHFKALPFTRTHEGRRCYEDKNEMECRAECRVELIHSLCECIPFSLALAYPQHLSKWQEKIGTKTICSNKIYKKCALQYDGSADVECRRSCLHSCELWTFLVISQGSVSHYTSMSADFRFGYGSFVYPLLEEYTSYTFQNLLGDLGGTIGLWMGASFLSIIHVVLFFSKRCAARKERKGGQTEESNKKVCFCCGGEQRI